MIERTLQPVTLSTHRLILGGHSFIAPLGNDPPPTEPEQRAIVEACLSAGVTCFDTTYAPERVAWGRAIGLDAGLHRPDVRPIVWNFFGPLTDPLPGPSAWTDGRLQEALDELLPWTGSPHVVIHALGDVDVNRAQAAVVRRWKEAGRVSAVGLWPGADWDWAKQEPGRWDFVVSPFNVTNAEKVRPLFQAARDLGWTTVATSPFVRGWELDRLTQKVVASEGISPDQAKPRVADALLRFAAFAPEVDHLIVAMRSSGYVGANVASLEKGPLMPAELQFLGVA